MSENNQNWFKKHKVLSVVLGFILLIILVNWVDDSETNTNTSVENKGTSADVEQLDESEEDKPAVRKVRGKTTTLGAGTFTGGKDVVAGLYDVTPGSGQSGNFIVNQGSSYNEVLGSGFGVSKVRANISDGDKIKISGLSSVKFTPVKSAFITAHKPVNLYAGTFVVGEDIGEGRYNVRPGSGQSGNFIVNEGASYNEILGSEYGVSSVSADLSYGDKITISGMSEVSFKPSN